MFSRIRNFLSRHQRKFIIGSVAIGGTVFLVRYTQRKLREWQEKEAREMLEKTKRRQYYDSTERTCNQMISSLAINLRESVVNALNTENVLNNLKSKNCDKVATWTKLKVMAIARSAVIVYSETMLAILLTIQMNLISGYMFKDSQSSIDCEKANGTVQAKFMSLCSYFMNNGINNLCSFIEEKVNDITRSISLKDELTLRDIEQIYWSVVSSISADTERDPTKNLGYYMLSPVDELENVPLKRMVNETLDLLESEEVQNLMRSSVNNGFVLLIDHISEYFGDTSQCRKNTDLQNHVEVSNSVNCKDVTTVEKSLEHKPELGFIDFNTATMRVAKIIPIIHGQVPANPSPGDMPSHWLDRLLNNYQLKILGANIYEAVSF